MIEVRPRPHTTISPLTPPRVDTVPRRGHHPLAARNLAIAAVALLSVAAWLLTLRHGLVLAYNDSLSHLDIARQVVDSQQPGLAQLGGVWLPLNQLLYLPLVWNSWAWHSGFAGSLISMVAFIITVTSVYYTVREVTDSRAAAAIGGLAVALSPNLLYLQATPLTEPVFLALLSLSALYLVKYLKSHDTWYVVILAAVTALSVSARYDGWFVAGTVTLVLAFYELRVRHLALNRALGILTLYLAPVLFAMGLWLLWNYVLFDNPVYSFVGPASAHAQQAAIQSRFGLITHLAPSLDLKAYVLDAWDNLGTAVSVLGLMGWGVFLLMGGTPRWFRLSLLAFFISEAVFNVIALYLGFSILNIPQLHWNPSGQPQGAYFNVRYGITALPMAAVGCGLLVSSVQTRRRGKPGRARRRVLRSGIIQWALTGILAPVIALQSVAMAQAGLITVQDGTIGSSSFANTHVSSALSRMVDPGQQVLMAESYYNGVVLRSGLKADSFIYEGIRRKWKRALYRPIDYAQWIVMANGNIGDPVYSSLVLRGRDSFLADYRLAYAARHANVYERKPLSQIDVVASGTQLMDGSRTFSVRGVDSYDLAYQTPGSIRETFAELSGAGINTIRFWLFGDGFPAGVQPSAGLVSAPRLATVDYIFAEADRYHLRLIPTLTNNWTDFGGMDQYLAWEGLPATDHDAFYNDPAVISLYENYINHIVTHRNSITGVPYGQDPAILAWDIANEPRVTRPQDAGLITAWVDRVAHYLHSIDPHHLVTVSLGSSELTSGERAICGSPDISLCSAHLYPAGKERSELQRSLRQIAHFAVVATTLHKPIVMSELGVSKATRPFGEPPLRVLRSELADVGSDGYVGWLIWNWAQAPDTSYGFSPTGLHGAYTLRQLRSIAAGSRRAIKGPHAP